MLAGIIGCLILGVGLSYTFAIVLKVYNKWFTLNEQIHKIDKAPL